MTLCYFSPVLLRRKWSLREGQVACLSFWLDSVSKETWYLLLMLQLWPFSFNFNGNNQHPIIWVFILASYYFAQRKASDSWKSFISNVRSLRRRGLFLASTLETVAWKKPTQMIKARPATLGQKPWGPVNTNGTSDDLLSGFSERLG